MPGIRLGFAVFHLHRMLLNKKLSVLVLLVEAHVVLDVGMGRVLSSNGMVDSPALTSFTGLQSAQGFRKF